MKILSGAHSLKFVVDKDGNVVVCIVGAGITDDTNSSVQGYSEAVLQLTPDQLSALQVVIDAGLAQIKSNEGIS